MSITECPLCNQNVSSQSKCFFAIRIILLENVEIHLSFPLEWFFEKMWKSMFLCNQNVSLRKCGNHCFFAIGIILWENVNQCFFAFRMFLCGNMEINFSLQSECFFEKMWKSMSITENALQGFLLNQRVWIAHFLLCNQMLSLQSNCLVAIKIILWVEGRKIW